MRQPSWRRKRLEGGEGGAGDRSGGGGAETQEWEEYFVWRRIEGRTWSRSLVCAGAHVHRRAVAHKRPAPSCVHASVRTVKHAHTI